MANVQKERRKVFEEIYGVSIFSDVLDLFENDYNRYKNKGFTKIQELYKHYSYSIFFMYSPSSIRNNLVKFRNVIKANGGKYQATALEAFTVDAIYAPIKSKDKDTKKELKEKVQSGDTTKIDPSIVVSQIQALKTELDTKSYSISSNQKEPNVRAYRIVAMLGLATGRRFTELMKTLEIKKRGTKITFDGLLKGNSEAIEGHIISLSYSEVKKYLKELREFAQTEDMTESEVNSKYAKVFNNAMKRIGVTNVKSTRHNYSVAGSQLFKKDGESLEDTITRILGHKEIFTSALNYT
jgi:hypothetical protein